MFMNFFVYLIQPAVGTKYIIKNVVISHQETPSKYMCEQNLSGTSCANP